MYLVEVTPGQEELFKTGEEFEAALRSGHVNSRSRIYHRARSSWLPVTLHPKYKAVAGESQRPPSHPPLERSSWTYFH